MPKNTWIVVGSSKSAPDMLPKAMEDYPDATTITTNAGVKLFVPDIYFINEDIAARMFRKDIYPAQKEGATVLVTTRAECAVLKHGVTPDELIAMDDPVIKFVYNPEKFTECKFSGLFTVQIALSRGAERLALVGHEGYGRGDDDYWYAHPVPHKPELSQKFTREYIQPYWQSVIDACPHVEFIFYGKLNYKLTGDNVRHEGGP